MELGVLFQSLLVGICRYPRNSAGSCSEHATIQQCPSSPGCPLWQQLRGVTIRNFLTGQGIGSIGLSMQVTSWPIFVLAGKSFESNC